MEQLGEWTGIYTLPYVKQRAVSHQELSSALCDDLEAGKEG